MKYVKKSNNPQDAAAVLIAADAPKSVVCGLEKLGIKVIIGGKIDYSVKGVSFHIDTQIYHVGGNTFVVSPHLYNYYKKILTDAELLKGKSIGQSAYPDDAAYNVASVGKNIVHNFKYTDETILKKISGKKIHVSQGYSKCSICIVDENSVITEDDGIAKTLARHNIDVLKISVGDVTLKGLEYGFLGGSSGKISKNKLVFAGDITAHRDYESISKFCMDRRVEPISLSEDRLIDIGSIIPIIEKE